MSALHYTPESELDLDALWDSDEDAAALIEVLLVQFEESPGLIDELCRENRHVTHKPEFQVKRFKFMWKKGYTIYTLKVWPDEGREIHHRVLYAHDPQKDDYYILAIMQRDINYEADRELIQKLESMYENLGIARYR